MRYRAAVLLFIAALAGCEGFPPDPPPPPHVRLALALETKLVTVPRTRERTIAAAVTRIGEVPVNVVLAVEGAPHGVTAVVRDHATAGDVTTMRVTLMVAEDAPVGTHVLYVRATGQAVKRANISSALDPLTLVIVERPDYTVGLSKQVATMIRGGTAPIALALSRTNFDGPVTVSLVGPPEVTAAFSQNPVAGDSALVTLSAAAAADPGNYEVVVRGSAAGMTDREISVTVTITDDRIQLLAPDTVTAAQGGAATAEIHIQRSDYPGAVAVSAEELPAGVTADFQPAEAAGASAVMALTAGAQAVPGLYTFMLRGQGTGVPDVTVEMTLELQTSSVAVSVSPSSVRLYQEGTATAGASISRVRFPGAVRLEVDGGSPGLSVVAEPEIITGTAATLQVQASAAVPPGDYDFQVRAVPVASEPGESHAATLRVAVRPRSSDANVMLDWSACAPPDWIAFQDGAEPWGQAPLDGGIAQFAVTADKGGFAYVEGGNTLTVRYMTLQELAAEPFDMCPPPVPAGKTVTGRAEHTFNPPVPTIEAFAYSLGGGTATTDPFRTEFNITPVRPGIHDLVVTGWVSNPSLLRRSYIRRDIEVQDDMALDGVVNLLGPGSFPRHQSRLGVTGSASAGDRVVYSFEYRTTPACTPAILGEGSIGGTVTANINLGRGVTVFGVPEEPQRPDDFHVARLTVGSATSARTLTTAFHRAGDRTFAMPPAIGPTVTGLPGSYKRLQANLGSVAPVYNRSAALRYDARTHVATVTVSRDYLGDGTVIAAPDLFGVSGWVPSFAPPPDATGTWTVVLDGANGTGSLCAEGRTFVQATRSGEF